MHKRTHLAINKLKNTLYVSIKIPAERIHLSTFLLRLIL